SRPCGLFAATGLVAGYHALVWRRETAAAAVAAAASAASATASASASASASSTASASTAGAVISTAAPRLSRIVLVAPPAAAALVGPLQAATGASVTHWVRADLGIAPDHLVSGAGSDTGGDGMGDVGELARRLQDLGCPVALVVAGLAESPEVIPVKS
ncbi:MAG: hypothetical protein WAR57_07120, partial [Candidatus Phosphoribacter sp.]